MNSDSKRIHMMLRSKSRAGSIESGKKRHSSIFSRTISASKLCRSDAMGSQFDNNALVSLERKSSVKHPSENGIDRHLIMQEKMGRLEEELRETREQLGFVEEEKNIAIHELSEMKHAAHKANIKASDGLSPSKSRELYAEVRTLKEILTNKQEELKIKDSNIKSLKLELEKAKKCELKLLEKDASLGKVKEEFSHVKAFKIRLTDWLSDFRRRVQELEDEVENRKLSESHIFDAWLSKTKQFEQIKIELKESKLEIASVHEKIEPLNTCSKQNGKFLNHSRSGEISNSIEKEIKNLKSEFGLAKENEKIASSKAKALNDKMKLANEAEENSRKEVATMKEMIKSIMARNKMSLDEAKKETKLYRNTTERLKLEAEESLLAWNERELSFIACIKELQEERDLALHEVTKLNESLKAVEQTSIETKEENMKLRDILKQAINEANAAADLARCENSQLKDCLAIKG